MTAGPEAPTYADPTHQLSERPTLWTRVNTSEATPGVVTPLHWVFYRAAESGMRASAYDRGIYDEADRLSWEAVSADPSDANMDTRGCVLAMMGRGQEAVPLLERGLVGIEALGLGDEERGWCHSFMAKAYLDSGAESEARSHAHIAAGFGVSIPALQEVQERLGLSQGD